MKDARSDCGGWEAAGGSIVALVRECVDCVLCKVGDIVRVGGDMYYAVQRIPIGHVYPVVGGVICSVDGTFYGVIGGDGNLWDGTGLYSHIVDVKIVVLVLITFETDSEETIVSNVIMEVVTQGVPCISREAAKCIDGNK